MGVGLSAIALFFCLSLFVGPLFANEVQDNPLLSLSGLVKFPFHFSGKTLSQLPQTQVRAIEASRHERIAEEGWFRTYRYYGVSLKTLLELAHVEKEEGQFRRLMDLAIVVRGSSGQAVLSWAEICNVDSKGAIIALRSETVQTLPAFPTQAPDQKLFPRLVLGGDFYADRYVDNVFSIEVVSPAPPATFNKGKHTYSPAVTIGGDLPRPIVIEGLSRYAKIAVVSKQSGHDPGYFGILSFSGASLLEILSREGISLDRDTVILATSSDGYRACLSYGELVLSPNGKRIILADKSQGKAFGEFGRFNLIFPDDQNADRWVKTLKSIEIIRLRVKPHLYVVGAGGGDSSLLTLSGLSVLGKAQAFVCEPELYGRFRRYLGNKPVLFNPLDNMAPYYAKTHPGVSLEEAKKIAPRLREEGVQRIKAVLAQGKDVALLEHGDPTISAGGTHWFYSFFRPEEITIVPGICPPTRGCRQ